LTAASGRTQQPLALNRAIELALANNPAVRGAGAAVSAAAQRLKQAHAGYLPRVDYSESVQLGTNPVYVFGSLLEQHRFQEHNFDLQSLNRPDPLSNFSTQLTADQVVFDGFRTRDRVELARTSFDMTEQKRRQTETDILLATTEAYYAAVLRGEEIRMAERAVAVAEADLERAQTMMHNGMTTESDVLALRVNRASVLDNQIRARNNLLVAFSRLNNVMGAPLDTEYLLTTALEPAPPVSSSLDELEEAAGLQHPSAMQANMSLSLAQTAQRLARHSLLPEITAQGTFEVNRRSFVSDGGSNWMTGVTLRWNLFNGFSDRARAAEAEFLTTEREEERRNIASALRLQVRQAYLDLQAANSRMDVAQAAVADAEESHRIVANRYEAGLATATDLLRSQTALSESKTRNLAAVFDQKIATVRLARAAGILTPSSEAVQP
jgi:outer membrane protein TolC